MSTRFHPRIGFTLVEVMVAIAVLALLFVMLSQIILTASSTWRDGLKRENDFTKARALLDLFATDVEAGVFRTDLAAFTGTGINFYTKRAGIGTNNWVSVRNVSLVQYGYNTTTPATAASASTLQRGDMYIPWSTTSASLISFGNTANYNGNTPTFRDMVPGVVAYQTLFVYANGALSTTYTPTTANPLRAVALTLAVVDDQSLQQLSTGQITSLRSALQGAVTGTRSVKADWESYLSSGMPWSSYPKELAGGLKIFERYVYICQI